MQNSNWREEKRLAFNFRLRIIIISPPHRSQCNVSGTVEGCKFLTCAFILINSLGLVPHHKIWKVGNLWNKISTVLMKANTDVHCSLFAVSLIWGFTFLEIVSNMGSVPYGWIAIALNRKSHFWIKRATWFMSWKHALFAFHCHSNVSLQARQKRGMPTSSSVSKEMKEVCNKDESGHVCNKVTHPVRLPDLRGASGMKESFQEFKTMTMMVILVPFYF